MPKIEVLSQQTIDKIAAGEVVERPASVVKELVENSIDAKATAVTVEIKEGGVSFIRITDNGCGIEKEQVSKAFLRHSTSKIRNVEDLLTVSSLGFRGEALSSIAAVSQVELITKPLSQLSGVRYIIEGGKEISLEEIGAPEGTTFLVRNLFYNTPARRKFLKTAVTEAGYISDLMEHMALSHPEVSFKLIINNQVKLHTSGNSNLKEIIYHIYGREIAANLIEINQQFEDFSVFGYIGKPLISRGNRNFENYFINGRYVKSSLIAKSIEEGYKSFVMQHKYPFTVLHLSIPGELLDVNVHPTKMELRFRNQEQVYENISKTICDAINASELIYQVDLEEKKEKEIIRPVKTNLPEPFEKKRLEVIREAIKKDSPYERKYPIDNTNSYRQIEIQDLKVKEESAYYKKADVSGKEKNVEKKLLKRENVVYHRIIGQLFDTYWLVQMEDKLYIIDQHAAHEKVLYERTMSTLATREYTSQTIFPPMLLSLSMQEEELLKKYEDYFTKMGFVIEYFGGKEYAVTSVPANLFGLNEKVIMIEMLDSLAQLKGNETPDIITEKIASMSCKAAVKGNQTLSRPEIEKLIDELLTLKNPYHCPHGRPTIIAMSKYELEKKFKRVL